MWTNPSQTLSECTIRLTVNVLHHLLRESVPGDGGEDLGCPLPPGEIVGGAGGSDGAEQQGQVILLGEFLSRLGEVAQTTQELQSNKAKRQMYDLHERFEDKLIKKDFQTNLLILELNSRDWTGLGHPWIAPPQTGEVAQMTQEMQRNKSKWKSLIM